MFKLGVILLFLVDFTQSARILCYFAFPSYSHQVTFQPIWRELARRGHDLTVITPNPIKDKTLRNLKEIDLHDVSYGVMEKHNISSFGVNDEIDSTDMSVFFNSMGELIQIQLESIKDLIENRNNETFDLLIVEIPFAHAILLSETYKCPLIGITSMPLHFNFDEYFGNQNHPIVSPDLNLPFSRNLSFFQRVKSVGFNLMYRIMIYSMRNMMREMLSKHFHVVDFKGDLFYKIELVLTNVNPVLHPRKPTVPNVIEFSGIHINPPKELSKDLQKYMDDSKQGVIYMSLGSNIKSAALGERKINIILETFSRLPFNFLWKFEAEDLPNKPKNVKIQKWFRQQDVLRHPNLKLFITQGGLQSLDEAMYTKTPVVCIPFFGDQYGNARKVNDIGMGLSIQNSKITVESFKAIILEALDERFAKRAEELYDIVTDQPMPALNKTIYWIEYVLRHKDLSHLKTAAATLPFYQYFMLDVIAFFLLILAAVICVIKILLTALCKCLCRKKKEKIN